MTARPTRKRKILYMRAYGFGSNEEIDELLDTVNTDAPRPARLCPRGHDTLVVGRTRARQCRQCHREDQRVIRATEKAARPVRLCVACDEPIPPEIYRKNITCGKLECVKLLRDHGRELGSQKGSGLRSDESMRHVPPNEGLSANAFSDNVVPKDEYVIKLPGRPFQRSYGVSW